MAATARQGQLAETSMLGTSCLRWPDGAAMVRLRAGLDPHRSSLGSALAHTFCKEKPSPHLAVVNLMTRHYGIPVSLPSAIGEQAIQPY